MIPGVGKDPRYLMCFAATRSEIVVPIKGSKGMLGETDIDSSRLSAFSENDRETLEEVALLLAFYLESKRFVSH